ncbi:Fic family protein [bacterium]|nr:Fic family protein [bacterium]
MSNKDSADLSLKAADDFATYIRQIEPDKRQKGEIWSTAIGLQQVDNLTPSAYLYQTAKRNVEGELTLPEANHLINDYYQTKKQQHAAVGRQEEADKVASRIALILSEQTFNFSPAYLSSIHRQLFGDIYSFAGQWRDYNISKQEWILNGASVIYAPAFELQAALAYDFDQERVFSYEGLDINDIITHVSGFIAKIWQIHPFGEGNTRTVAVFSIKYWRKLGFELDNEPFAQHSWYFRNALVRANYSNLCLGVKENHEYLERFWQNVILGEKNDLSNQELKIDG